MKPGPKPKKVICVDTGVIYESVEEAKKQTGSKSLRYNLKYGVPYKGKTYKYYNKKESVVCYKDDSEEGNEEIDYELWWKNYFQAFRDQHPEYNNVTRTMTPEGYANYLKSRKERSL